jgi:hypothetical protein
MGSLGRHEDLWMKSVSRWLLRLTAISAVITVAWMVYLERVPTGSSPYQLASLVRIAFAAAGEPASSSTEMVRPDAGQQSATDAADVPTGPLPASVAPVPGRDASEGAEATPVPAPQADPDSDSEGTDLAAEPPPSIGAPEDAAQASPADSATLPAVAPAAASEEPPAVSEEASVPASAAEPATRPGEETGDQGGLGATRGNIAAEAAATANAKLQAEPQVPAQAPAGTGTDAANAASGQSQEPIVDESGAADRQQQSPPARQQSWQELWLAARQAAWEGDLAAAEQRYEQLLTTVPYSYEIYGELGNILFARGSRERAADAYYQAALRLAAAGLEPDALALLWTVKRLNPSRGAELERELLGTYPSNPARER